MNRIIVLLVSVIIATFAHLGLSQVNQPQMSLHSFDALEANDMGDGRVSRRMSGAIVGVNRVEWAAGTKTVPHNHANELIVVLVEGRLRAISGDQEFVMEPGDITVIPSFVAHGYEALEDSVTLESYGPT